MKIFALVFGGWMFTLCLHEFSHALVAYWGGDKSVKEKGYLTFNPLKYTHPMLSIVFPLFFLLMGGIGLPGGAVYIDHSRLRSRIWESAVSLAGPLSNTLVVVFMGLPVLLGWIRLESGVWYWAGYAFLFKLQISAVLLNMIPIPPLDGFGTISAWLPRDLRRSAHRVSDMGLWVIFAVLWLVPPANEFFWGIVNSGMDLFAVPRELGYEGYRAMRFW